jgi:hypothetical protein
MIHGGVVADSLINYFDKFGPELLVIQFGFLVILSTLFLWLWFSNRRKYHNLKHAIPANVVKSYLDSIIQNSTALKSSLFRGGGLETRDGTVPSVMPLQGLIGGENLAVSGAPSTALLEELNQRKAQIASLESQLQTSQKAQRDLEAKLAQTQNQLSTAETRIRELEALLAQGHAASGGDEAIKSELNMVTKERNELRDRLKEFEIIADDLANLKRLQQENEQLKRSLGAQRGASTSIASASEVSATSVSVEKEVAPEPVAQNPEVSDLLEDPGQSMSGEGNQNDTTFEDFLGGSEPIAEAFAPESEAAPIEEIAAAPEPADDASRAKSEKTPEDLLSEFEKMLG